MMKSHHWMSIHGEMFMGQLLVEAGTNKPDEDESIMLRREICDESMSNAFYTCRADYVCCHKR